MKGFKIHTKFMSMGKIYVQKTRSVVRIEGKQNRLETR